MNDNIYSQPRTYVPAAEEKAEFYRQTYIHLSLAVLAFVLVEVIFFQTGLAESFSRLIFSSGSFMWIGLLVGFMVLSTVATKWTMNASSKGMQYLGLGLYVIMEAVIFMPLLMLAVSVSDSSVLHKAILVTAGLFAGLTAIVFTTKKDFSFLRSGIMIGFGVAFTLIIAGALFGFDMGLWFSVGMVILAGAAILYETSNLVHRYRSDQYVAASLGLFASLMLLFWYILRIFMSND